VPALRFGFAVEVGDELLSYPERWLDGADPVDEREWRRRAVPPSPSATRSQAR
jgi:hypothetical protein